MGVAQRGALGRERAAIERFGFAELAPHLQQLREIVQAFRRRGRILPNASLLNGERLPEYGLRLRVAAFPPQNEGDIDEVRRELRVGLTEGATPQLERLARDDECAVVLVLLLIEVREMIEALRDGGICFAEQRASHRQRAMQEEICAVELIAPEHDQPELVRRFGDADAVSAIESRAALQ
jgi:predicted RNA binding protein YcfA (HicA-like mRNA interferase family)